MHWLPASHHLLLMFSGSQVSILSQLLGVAKVLLEVTPSSGSTFVVMGCHNFLCILGDSGQPYPSSSKLSRIGPMILLHIAMGLSCGVGEQNLGPGME